MNIFKIFDTIEEIVFSSQRLPWPFTQWSVLNRQNFMRMLDKMRHSVPEEMKTAREVTREADRLLAEAHDRAEAAVAEARSEATSRLEAARDERERLINATEVVQTARARAVEVEEAARIQVREMEKMARARCQEMRERAEAEARRVVEEARAEAHRCEQELDAWVVRRLADVERELERALTVMRTHRRQVEQTPPASQGRPVHGGDASRGTPLVPVVPVFLPRLPRCLRAAGSRRSAGRMKRLRWGLP